MFALAACALALRASVAGAQTAALAPHLTPIRNAHYPALSPDGKRLCFEYLGDLWTVASEGGVATRLTINPAYDAWPHWSPDGRWIAFSSNRQGNFDVYIVPARGGDPRQLTFHTADDYALDWSPDGSCILFGSAREGRFTDLYTVSVTNGRTHRITYDRTQSRYGVFSPDGQTIAYARGRQEWWRPRYRGSGSARIYTIRAAGGRAIRWTDYDGFDSFPLWQGGGRSLLFVSDRSGTCNLWRLDGPMSKAVQVTHHTGEPVRFPSISRDGSHVAYECGFRIWLADTNTEHRTPNTEHQTPDTEHPVTIYAPSDTLTNAVQRATLADGARSLAVAADGSRLAIALRGDIWTLPADGGDAERMTRTDAAEYDPVWSPDGDRLAYVSDRDGNLDVFVMDVKTKAETRITSDPADDTAPKFSPDGRFLAYVRTGGSQSGLWVQPLADKGAPKSEAAVRVGSGPGVGSYDWSPDSRWLVYTKRDGVGTTDLWIGPTVGGTPVNVTKYPGINTDPMWSRDGHTIIFRAARGDAAAGLNPAELYALPLAPDPDTDRTEPGAGPPGSGDAEVPDAQVPRRRRAPSAEAAPPGGAGGPGLPVANVPARATAVRIAFADIENRSRALTSGREPIGAAALSPDSRTVLYSRTAGDRLEWWVVDVDTGRSHRITDGAETGAGVEFTGDAGRAFFLNGQGAIRVLARFSATASPVGFSASLDVDRRAEVREAFNEAWRMLRTQFYDPKFHGADWTAVRAKYEPLLAETAAKEDFAWLLEAMIGELNASHLGVMPAAEPSPATAYLGLTFDQDYVGPGLRVTAVLPHGPCDRPGRRVEVGQYLLAIDGQEVTWGERMYAPLLGKAGKAVELTVGAKSSGEGAWKLRVEPLTKQQADDLAYDEWVAQRRDKVDALSGGRLAYMHIKAMDQTSLEKFRRELFGYAQSKEGLVLDIRFNGGGNIHDELLSILTRRPHGYSVPRDQERSTSPRPLWARPTVLLMNEYSASDAEIFPSAFREYGLGKLVGVTTLGAVIGTRDITLVDGTRFRIPTVGWYTLDGKDLENYGVQPDVRVEMSPEDYAADNDRQLEAGVRTLLEQIGRRP